MKERVKFVLEWERRWEEGLGRVNVAELCRIFGISRQTGYVWIRRYRDAGHDVKALQERSRRPRGNPRAVSEEIEDLVVAARKAHPRWGPVLLRQWLVTRHPRKQFPSTSCMASILRRRGLVKTRRRRRKRPIVVTPPFPECTAVNQVWCMDFKGWFYLGTRQKCHPFTLLDAHSRFLLRCEALLEPNGKWVQSILDSAFREFGLPVTIRSDGGPPFFAAQSPAGLSMLSIWLLRLGIALECIAPASPQQNGRLERFHRTLKQHVAPAAAIRAQQRAFDLFRAEYNNERPHTALELQPPTAVYRRSARRYPRPLLDLRTFGLFPHHAERLDRRGSLLWKRRRIFIGEAFAYEFVNMWPGEGARWDVYLGEIHLGFFDEGRASRGFVPVRRPRKQTMRLSSKPDDADR